MPTYDSSRQLYKRLIIRLIITLLFITLIVFVIPKLAKMLMPFVIALIGAAIINPIANRINALVTKINKNIMIPKKITTLVLNILVLVVFTLLIYYATYTIVREVIGLASNIQQNWSSIALKYDELMERLSWGASVLPPQALDILEDIKDSIFLFVQNLSKNIVSLTVSTTASGITSTGTLVINLVTFFLALFFISSDLNRLNELADRYISRRVLNTFAMLKTSVVSAVGGYFKAQLILSTFAFAFMFISLFIYGQPYAFTIALFLGFIDLLPVVGTIAFLLPWGAIEIVMGNLNKGIFLILLGVIFFLVRRVIEPKVMGSQTGLPPLLALLSTYVGLQFSGVWGAVLGPVVVMLMISVAKSGIFTNTVADLKMAYNKVLALLDGEST